MLVSEFDYDLPEELIAQIPSEKRENSRMMVLTPVITGTTIAGSELKKTIIFFIMLP